VVLLQPGNFLGVFSGLALKLGGPCMCSCLGVSSTYLERTIQSWLERSGALSWGHLRCFVRVPRKLYLPTSWICAKRMDAVPSSYYYLNFIPCSMLLLLLYAMELSWEPGCPSGAHRSEFVRACECFINCVTFLSFCRMHRQPEHVMAFLLAELGTSGSLDGQQRLVVKGRFAPKVFEGILRRYVSKYLISFYLSCCHT
jgi:hypothetical protein